MAGKTNFLVFYRTCLLPDFFSSGRKTLPCSLLLLTLLAALLAFPALSSAEAVTDHKQSLETGIQKYWINIRRLQEGLRLQRDEREHKLTQERDLLEELDNIDNRLKDHQEKLNALRGKMATQQDQITVKEIELGRVKSKKHLVQIHLQKRLSAYYKLGTIGFINVAFSSESLPELLSFDNSFQSLIGFDQKLITSYRQSISETERTKEALTLEKTLLLDFITQEEQEKNHVDRTKQEKEDLLTRIRTQTKLHEQAIKEMEEANTRLSGHLNVMEKKEQLLDQGFLMNRGKLSPPVNGTVITLFNQEKANKLGISSKSKGISIKSPDGAKVKALFDGTVLFSGYLKGYGNTVIVDHGYQYYSITSRVENLLKKKGEDVRTGDYIAIVGDTATLIDEGIYLEIRHGEESLDPLQWLDKGKLTLETNEKELRQQ